MRERKLLISALERLALDAEMQIRYLTGLGVAPSADELALELDDAAQGVRLSAEAADRVAELDSYLDAMSGEANASMWTFDALRTRPEWEEARRLAKQALAAVRE